MGPLRLASLSHPGSCLHPLFVPFYGWVVLPSTQGQSILIMGAFHVFKFTCLLKCMTPPRILVVLSRVLRHVQNGEKLELLDAHILSGGRTRRHFAFLFQFSACKQVFLVGSFVPPFCTLFWCAFFGDLAKWPARVVLLCCLGSRAQKAVKYLMEKTRVR